LIADFPEQVGLDPLRIADSFFDVIPARYAGSGLQPEPALKVLVQSTGLNQQQKLQSGLKIFGLTAGSIGAVTVVGCIIHAPLLYYYREGINSAVTFHTAILFVLSGVGLVCLSD
jgi:hypothetical protein